MRKRDGLAPFGWQVSVGVSWSFPSVVFCCTCCAAFGSSSSRTMPQEYHVLRCFSCGTFQVHIVKKAPKWSCKMCGAKQSFKRNFGRGSGKDCREQVMRLNELRVLKGESEGPVGTDEEGPEEGFSAGPGEQEPGGKKPLHSKWAEYLEEECASGSEDNTSEWLSEAAEKRKRRKKMSSCRSSKKRKSSMNEPSFGGCQEVSEEVSEGNASEGGNPGSSLPVSRTETVKCKRYRSEMTNELKHSKYSKYLDDADDADDGEEEEKKPKVHKNIFSSDFADLEDEFTL